MNGTPKDILEGKTVGQLLAEGFEDLADEIRNDKTKVSEKYTCHRIAPNLNPEPYSPELVKKTRKILGASQAMFARFLGVSPNTVRAWEQGVNTPHDSACRFMDEIRHNPDYFQNRIRESIVAKKNIRPRKAHA